MKYIATYFERKGPAKTCEVEAESRTDAMTVFDEKYPYCALVSLRKIELYPEESDALPQDSDNYPWFLD